MTRYSLLLTLAVLLCPPAQAGDEVSITYEAGQNVRELAQTHLANPDLWPDILAANGLDSAHELKPGMPLKIPVKLILAVEKNVREANDVIQQASQKGARILATASITAAIASHLEALNKRRQGDWQAALEQAAAALAGANQALKETERLRNQPGEALLENSGGTVQRRPPGGWAWQQAELQSVLREQEKLRTLSDSFAEVRFRDDSNLRLNANAELLIQTLRTDALNRRESTGVVLQGGDIYALLGGNARSNQFDVQITGIETEIKSNNFWVGSNGGTTRLANYDGEIAVSAKGGKVVLKENQGTLVKANQAPTEARDLLPPPEELTPADYTVIYKDAVNLNWNAPDKAAAYWLEIAKDRDFKDLLVNDKGLRDRRFALPLPADGLYYWRVATLDSEGLPGAKSKSQFFKVQHDTAAPFLVLTTPAPGTIVAEARITVTGKSESAALLTCNDEAVELQADGAFSFERSLQPGANVLVLRAADPAGNLTTLELPLRYQSDTEVAIVYAESLPRLDLRHFVSRQETLTLSGHTAPQVKLDIAQDGGGFSAATFAGDNGEFQINLPLPAASQIFNVTATLPNGMSGSEQITVSRDSEAPRIVPDAPLPALTNTPALELRGSVEGGESLTLNGAPIVLDADGTFSVTRELKPGPNTLELIAHDLAGNSTTLARQVVLDSEAPQLLGHTFTPLYAVGGDTVTIEISARDANGLKAGARYTLNAGAESAGGYLRLCPERTCYRGEVRLPPNAKGKIILKSLDLEDYAGNRLAQKF